MASFGREGAVAGQLCCCEGGTDGRGVCICVYICVFSLLLLLFLFLFHFLFLLFLVIPPIITVWLLDDQLMQRLFIPFQRVHLDEKERKERG